MSFLRKKFNAVLGAVALYPPAEAYNRFRHALCTDGQEETVREILKKYPDATRWEKKPGDMQPLAYAMWQRQYETCGILVRHDPTILEDCREGRGTQLQHEMGTDNVKNMELLIALGANIHSRDAKGNGLLHVAARHTLYCKGIDILVKHGLDPTAKNADGDTPLLIAAGAGIKTFNALRAHDPDLSQRDTKGRTLMMRAAISDRSDVISNLIVAGANLEDKCAAGKTALDYALDGGKLTSSATLIENGAAFSASDARLLNCLADDREWGDHNLEFAVDARAEQEAEREQQRAQKAAEDQARHVADEIARITEGTREHVTVKTLRFKGQP